MSSDRSEDRIGQIRSLLEQHNCSIALIQSPSAIRWASDFTGSNGLLLVARSGACLFTDSRYQTQAGDEVQNPQISVEITGKNLFDVAARSTLFANATAVLADPTDLTISSQNTVAASAPAIHWTYVPGWLHNARAVKTPHEVERIRSAQRLTDQVFAELVELIRPGITERAVAAEIVHRHLVGGADKMSFDPIVASGPNGALPHAKPGDRQLQNGDMVVIDMGCMLNGYASDMTRTIAIGEPSDEARTVYAAVQRAQSAAIESAVAGITATDLDNVARTVLEEAGLGDAFVHSLGHGIGLDVHEWPRIAKTSSDQLPNGCAVTIEPGAYLPGRFGVRIEDIVVLRPGGCENLTSSPREMIVIR